jgi:hypothetical protein
MSDVEFYGRVIQSARELLTPEADADACAALEVLIDRTLPKLTARAVTAEAEVERLTSEVARLTSLAQQYDDIAADYRDERDALRAAVAKALEVCNLHEQPCATAEDVLAALSWSAPEGDAPPEHTLTQYGTTDCHVEGHRANVDDGKCSACGAAVITRAVAKPDEASP